MSDLTLPARVQIAANLHQAAVYEFQAILLAGDPVKIDTARAVVIERYAACFDLMTAQVMEAIKAAK